MAELDDVYTSAMESRRRGDSSAGTAYQSLALETMKQLLWAWYEANASRSIKLRIWKVGISVAVHRLRGLFELLAGPPPDADTT